MSIGVCNGLDTETVGLQVDIGQVSMDRIVGISITVHNTEGNAHDLIRHNGCGVSAGNGAGKGLDIDCGHGVIAAACKICLVGADCYRLCLGFIHFDQADRLGILPCGCLTAGSIGSSVVAAIAVTAVVNQSFHRHVSGLEGTGIVNVGLLFHLQIGIDIGVGDFRCVDAELGADTLCIGQALTQNLNVYIIADLNCSAGCQISCAGYVGGILVDLCFCQVYRAADKADADTLTRCSGLCIGNSRVIGQNFQTACLDALCLVVDVSLEGAVGVCLADKYAEGSQTCGSITAAVVGLGHCLALGLHRDLLGSSQVCVYNTGNHIGSYICDCSVGVDRVHRSREAGAVTLAAAGDNCAGADAGIGFIEPGDNADIVCRCTCIFNISILASQQSCFHEVHCQFCTGQGFHRSIEAGFCICITCNGNGYISVLRCRVTLRIAAGNTRRCINCGICQSNVGTAADYVGGKSLAGLGAHGTGAGSVIVIHADGLALDLPAVGISDIGAELTASHRRNLRQEQGHDAQIAAQLHIASCKGTAVGIDGQRIMGNQISVADEAAVLAAEDRIGGICLYICRCNADALTAAVAAAEDCQRTVEAAVIIKYTVRIKVGIDRQVFSFYLDILNQGFLLHIHIRHCHIRGDTDAGNVDAGRIDSRLRSCCTIGCDIHIAVDLDHSTGIGGGITHDTGIGLGQILGNCHVRVHIRSCQFHAAHSGGNDGLGIADIGIGNIQAGTGEVGLSIAHIALGLNQCFEGALCISIASMQAHGYNTKAKRCDVGNCRGFCIIGNLNIPCTQILCSQQCSAGCVGDCIGSACCRIHHADTCCEYQSLCHGTECTLQSVATGFCRNRQIVAAKVEITAAGLLRGLQGDRACDIQIAFTIHLCFLDIFQVRNGNGNLNVASACCCTCQNCISSCKADGIDGQCIRNQAAGGITGNQSSVIAGVSGNADIQCRCH